MTEEFSDIPDNFYRVSAKALILDEEKRFLLVFETKGLWALPGGGIDFDEKPEDALVREIREEMGLEVTQINERPSYFLTAPRKVDAWWVGNVVYETKLRDLNFTPSDECVKLRFFTKEEAMKEKLFPNVIEFVRIYDPKNH